MVNAFLRPSCLTVMFKFMVVPFDKSIAQFGMVEVVSSEQKCLRQQKNTARDKAMDWVGFEFTSSFLVDGLDVQKF